MLYALSQDGEKIRAYKNATGKCSICEKLLVPKCGRIVSHHWAHKAERDCDPWREPETEWHRKWKNLVPKEYCEVVIDKNGERHRADIRTQRGVVVELQHSGISVDEIETRERFYGDKMIWLFDASHACPDPIYMAEYSNSSPINEKEIRLNFWPPSWKDQDEVRHLLKVSRNSEIPPTFRKFRWKHPRKTVGFTKCKTYIDAGCNGILRLVEIYDSGRRCYGYGDLRPVKEFTDWLAVGCLQPTAKQDLPTLQEA